MKKKLIASLLALSLTIGMMSSAIIANAESSENAESTETVESSENAETGEEAEVAESTDSTGDTGSSDAAKSSDKEVTLRICNWEEYIDEGDWAEDETIDLESGDIIGKNSMIDDFEDWYLENYGVKVNVEYSTFGTNEDLYNMLTLGDTFDIVCPSEYMFMKLMAEKELEPLSEEFFDTTNELNYYIRDISPYIKDIFDSKEIKGEAWSKYAAGYMWGVTGFVYNPEVVSKEDASTWKILNNKKYYRQVTVKDNIRDTYFGAVGAIKSDLLTSEEFKNDPNYSMNLQTEMNDVSDETIAETEAYLQEVKDNVYSFESDAGKADMITGKVVANLQWSGDSVYTLDQAEEDGYFLNFAVPEESTDIYFDGWVMLKNGINGDAAKKQAAEAFMNFVSRPDNAIRNMYYIGYTSVIAGDADDHRIFEYADWNYGADEEDIAASEGTDAEDSGEEIVDYPLGYFFNGNNDDPDYVIQTYAEQLDRQLFAQYPSQDAISRSSIMLYFDDETSVKTNEMWIHVRCFNAKKMPAWGWVLVAAVVLLSIGLVVRKKLKNKNK